MKYKAKYPIIMGDKVYHVKDGIVDLPYELGDTFERVEEKKEEPKTDEKAELVKMAVELGIDSKSKLERNSIETLKKKIEEA
jgi:hypothetical protein